MLWDFFVNQHVPGLFQMSLVLLIPLMVVAVFHLLIILLLPVRWPAIRDRFREKLDRRLDEELERAYLPIPTDLAATLQDERRLVENLLAETREVAEWLAARQQSAHVKELYGA